ncbi:MAG TPA: glycosyltransferase family 9 protein [bacterium]|nr:glycosyltransferase family 9 protein [bacterium]
MDLFKPDCRHFTGEKPCAPHKAEGVVCRDCPRYDPVQERILIVKLDAAGDVLRSTSILPAFKAANPGLSIWWVTENGSKPLLEKNPYIDVLLGIDPTLQSLLSTVTFTRAFNFDMGRKAAAILGMVHSPIKKGFGLSPEGSVTPLDKTAETWFEMGIFDSVKRANQRTYQDHLFTLGGLKYQGERPQLILSAKEKEWAQGFARKNKLSKFRKIVGFNIGSGGRWPMKRWRLDGFEWLAKAIKKESPKTGILLYGGPEERDLMPKLARKLKGVCLATGTENTLRQFASLVDLCDVLVSGDTLALHIGIALKKRLVAYFGPTSDTEIDVYGSGEKVMPVSPCECYYQGQCTAKISCMQNLKEKDMLAAVLRQLKQS